jgi:prevent-host-death family protein
MVKAMKQAALSEIKDDLSKYLRMAENEVIVITRHGKPAGVLVGFARTGAPEPKGREGNQVGRSTNSAKSAPSPNLFIVSKADQMQLAL